MIPAATYSIFMFISGFGFGVLLKRGDKQSEVQEA